MDCVSSRDFAPGSELIWGVFQCRRPLRLCKNPCHVFQRKDRAFKKGRVPVQIIWIVAGLALACFAVVPPAIRFARIRERKDTAHLQDKLLGTPARHAPGTVSLSSLADLPEPVERYFRYALGDGQAFIRVARYKQKGQLRTEMHAKRWLSFEATEVVTPRAPGFIWDARIRIVPLLHVRVRDAYLAGQASGRVSLLSAYRVASEHGSAHLNSASLHRYLAEAVWYPTALLPAAGVQWKAIDKNRALATLKDSGIAVSLEFHFNDAGEITSVSTPGRWRSVKDGFRLTPWEGRFHTYEKRAGMRIPVEGEVGWYGSGQLQLVWKGRIEDISYEFAQ
jgi:hypothetical protein